MPFTMFRPLGLRHGTCGQDTHKTVQVAPVCIAGCGLVHTCMWHCCTGVVASSQTLRDVLLFLQAMQKLHVLSQLGSALQVVVNADGQWADYLTAVKLDLQQAR